MYAWLQDEELQQLMHDLGEAYVVGGSVRDALLGYAIADVDLATPLSPTEVRDVLHNKYRLAPTGFDHGTWTVIGSKRTYEVTSFRKDVATDGRRAVVEFSRHIDDDAFRRDFTFNALYMAADGTVIDPTLTGTRDLRARYVRFVGSASERCKEDYLRILRYFRFRAKFGGTMFRDREAFEAVSTLWPEVFQKVSVERVGDEMRKIMTLPKPFIAIAEMEEVGMLSKLFGPNHQTSIDFERLYENEHAAIPGRPFERRMAFMVEDVPVWIKDKAAARNISYIKTAAREDSPAKVAFRYKDMAVAVDAHVVRSTLRWEWSMDAYALMDQVENGFNATLPVDGDTLIAWGIPPGPSVGAALREAKEYFEETLFKATPEEIRTAVTEWARKTDTPLANLA